MSESSAHSGSQKNGTLALQKNAIILLEEKEAKESLHLLMLSSKGGSFIQYLYSLVAQLCTHCWVEVNMLQVRVQLIAIC